jgi:hypothetical protein
VQRCWLSTEPGTGSIEPNGRPSSRRSSSTPPRATGLVAGLAAVLLADAAFNALAERWTKDELDHLRFPERLRFVFPWIKCGSAVGLFVGLRWRTLGRVTARALVLYFLAAIGFHARARDPVRRHLSAVALLVWSALVSRILAVESSNSPSGASSVRR